MHVRRQRRLYLVLALAAAVPFAFSALAAPQRVASAERRVVLFYTGAVHGTLEPCGCTSDPLGDVARMTGIVRQAAAEGPVLVLDAGNLSYPGEEVPPKRREAADLRARFLARELTKLPFGGSALGEADLAGGPEKVQPRRLAANLTAAALVEPARVRELGGIKLGIFGVADPAAARRHGLKVEDPAAAAKREAARLRSEGAEIVICLAPLERPLARQVARAAEVDFVILGKGTGDGLARAEQVGDAFLVAPAVELQKIGRLELVLRPGAAGGRKALSDAGGAEAARLRREQIERTLASLELDLARWQRDPTADGAFVAAKRAEAEGLRAEKGRLLAGAWAAPATGSFFTNELVPLRRALPRDPAIAAAMRQLDKAVGTANLRHAEPPPKADPGRAFFVGDARCTACHKEEMAFWKTTVHASAWKTLVVGGKTGHDDCVSCHVTGYGEIGGSSLGFTKRLESVQCESCHGAGSVHVAEEGLEEPSSLVLRTAESTCKRCHNEKHSDTFDYTAYLRDVLGKGHGEAARGKLGDGPTGRQLRSAAIAKAKAAGEAQRKKL